MKFSLYNFLFIDLLAVVFTNSLLRESFADDSTEQFEEKYVSWDTDGQLYQETTYTPVNPNITLDTVNDKTSEWNIARTITKKWFEYYNSTHDLNQSADNNTICANAISGYASHLQYVDGVWAACQDPILPSECQSSVSSPCHPFIKYSGSGFQPDKSLRTIKMKLFLHGLAIVRLSVGVATNANCFDYSLRKDPFSMCEYIKVGKNETNKWTQVKTPFTGYNNTFFNQFTIQIIARFKSDFVLLDKVEGTHIQICGSGDNEAICTTTSPGPTRSNPPATGTSKTETTTGAPDSSTTDSGTNVTTSRIPRSTTPNQNVNKSSLKIVSSFLFTILICLNVIRLPLL